jgi:hypothetical protein
MFFDSVAYGRDLRESMFKPLGARDATLLVLKFVSFARHKRHGRRVKQSRQTLDWSLIVEFTFVVVSRLRSNIQSTPVMVFRAAGPWNMICTPAFVNWRVTLQDLWISLVNNPAFIYFRVTMQIWNSWWFAALRDLGNYLHPRLCQFAGGYATYLWISLVNNPAFIYLRGTMQIWNSWCALFSSGERRRYALLWYWFP